MKLAVLGWYGHNNCGDESYKVTMPAAFPGHSFQFVDRLNPQLIDWADAIIIGGGNVLKEFFLNQLKGITKPIYGLSVGAEKDFKPGIPFKHVWARDEFSVKTLQEAGVPVTFMPDLGLTLVGDPKAGREVLRNKFANERLDLYERVVTVVLNSYLTRNWENSLARDELHFNYFACRMANVADGVMASFVFLPFGTDASCDDRIPNAWSASKCKFWKKNYIEYGRPGVQETIDIIAASDVVVSSRLHSSVFAYTCGTPFVDITHHSKNANFLKSIGYEDRSMNYWEFNAAELKNKINDSFTIPKGVDEQVQSTRRLIQKELNEIRFGGQ